jgi:hypothetical protein
MIVTLSIGRNRSDGSPIEPDRWQLFQQYIAQLAKDFSLDGELLTNATGHGKWNNKTEQCAIFTIEVADGDTLDRLIENIRYSLPLFKQEAVALLSGETHMIRKED